ncbi:MAG: glycosyl hydrolase [Haliea sp.]|nr:glycosyl hydrolase [Haliea sp.]|tara:strand:+ start:95780 stop:96646 length:867 start_codon:yes stop_codon:yes gene_type:complete
MTSMKTWLARVLLGLLAATVLLVAAGYFTLRSMGLFRAPEYDTQAPVLPTLASPAILVFYKTSGYVHTEAIPAANALLVELAEELGYAIYVTDNGAVINPEQLSQFDVLVWNNNTGSVLSPPQQTHFRRWLENGGKWLGLHSASDNHFSWDWYVNEVIGAAFNGATRIPQQPRAQLVFENRDHPVLSGLPASIWLNDEFYSFSNSPRDTSTVLATLDESSYIEEQALVREQLRMGDHPIIWVRRVGEGAAVYSAIGHSADTYAIPEYRRLLSNALHWLIQGDHDSPAP